uniref:Helix-turn-helix domain-containing protein n=1 Tax=Trichuris muris TaxID=70415 RepID=A0A5S6PYV1_TRIMR
MPPALKLRYLRSAELIIIVSDDDSIDGFLRLSEPVASHRAQGQPALLQQLPPAIAIESFDGDPRKWDQFIGSFKALVHDVVSSDAQRIAILRQLLTPRLRASIAPSLYGPALYGPPVFSGIVRGMVDRALNVCSPEFLQAELRHIAAAKSREFQHYNFKTKPNPRFTLLPRHSRENSKDGQENEFYGILQQHEKP